MTEPIHRHIPKDDRAEGTWFIPANIRRLNDGTFLITPGKPVRKATIRLVSKWTGVPKKTLHALADAGFILREKPSPNQSWFYPDQVTAFLAKTREDPDFWDRTRTALYLQGHTKTKLKADAMTRPPA